MTAASDLERLLDDDRWIRRLARRLVRHFLRDESLSAIARADGLAVATVHERVHMDGRSVAFTMGECAQFTDGRTSVIQVPDTARTLALFLGDVRVLERPLMLDPGAPTVLRY